MANPFTVNPAQANLTPVMSGIGNIVKQNRAEQKRQAGIKEMGDVLSSGDPMKIADFSSKNPELKAQFEQAYGFTNDRTKNLSLEGYQRVISDPEQGLGYLQQLEQDILDNGGQPDNIRRDIEMYKQNPEAALERIKLGYAGITGDSNMFKPVLPGAGEREFNSIIKDFTEADKTKARRVEAGLDARAMGSAAQTIANEGTSDKVGQSQAKLKSIIKKAVVLAEAKAKENGEVFTDLSRAKAALPGLNKVVEQLRDLSSLATNTLGGKAWNTIVKETGFGSTKGSTARAKFIATIDNQVLPLLKPTFGAAFTVQEGDALRATLGDPNATPEEKMAQLDAFIDQKMRDIEAKETQLQGTPQEQTPQTATGPNGQKIILINNQWVPQ